MSNLFAGGAFALALAMSGAAAAQDASKCHLQQMAEMPVVFQNNKALVEVTLNGQPVRFLIDTGAQRTLLFKGPAEKVGLTPVGTSVAFEGVGGTRGAQEVTVAKFGLGKSSVNNLRLYVLPGGAGEGVAGILGEDILSRADLEFDLAHNALRMFDEKDCAHTSLAYWTKEPMAAELVTDTEFELKLVLNGTTIDALLDSGATTSGVTTAAAARVGGQRAVEKATGIVGGVGAGKVDVDTVTFATLAIGDEEIKQAKLMVGNYFAAAREDAPIGSKIKTSSSDGTEMMLGADFLRAHRVMISHKQNRMYFTYSGGPVFQIVAPAAEGAAAPAVPAKP